MLTAANSIKPHPTFVHLRLFITMAMATTIVAYAQNPITADSPYQIRYASNLTIGDSVVNISNSGGNGGVTLQSGTTAQVGGSICANVYVFTPDEEIVSCCSCPVTPNGLVSLSAQRDLIVNPLTRGTPTSIVIKLVATNRQAGTTAGTFNCTNSAAAIDPAGANLAIGMVAWGTTLHANTANGAGSYAVTETAFTPATLSTSEISRLNQTCAFVLAQGSGFGVCNSCRLGGLGGVRQ